MTYKCLKTCVLYILNTVLLNLNSNLILYYLISNKIQIFSNSTDEGPNKFKDDSETKINQLESKNSELEDIMKTQNTLITQLQNELKDYKLKLSHIEGDIIEYKKTNIIELEKNVKNHNTFIAKLQTELNDYKLKLSKIEEGLVIDNKTNLKISEKKNFNILHYTNQDTYSPSADALRTCANTIGLNFNVLEERRDNSNLKNNIDAVLVSTWSNTDKKALCRDL